MNSKKMADTSDAALELLKEIDPQIVSSILITVDDTGKCQVLSRGLDEEGRKDLLESILRNGLYITHH